MSGHYLRRSGPVGEFSKLSGSSCYTLLLNDSHDLVRGEKPLVTEGCLRVTKLCAYSPEGVVCGYDFDPIGKHVKADLNFLASWIPEFDRQKRERLPVPFALISRYQGFLLYEHPYGCSVAIASELTPALLGLFNAS